MKLIINRGTVVPFSSLPPNSIALDGYVQGAFLDVETNRYSFDHHGDCIRLVTSATCVQIVDAIKMGLDLSSIESVFVNDVDGDTALAVAMLFHPELVENRGFVDKVRLYGLIDAHGPAYLFHPEERRLLDQVDWAMQPCSQAYQDRTYFTCDLGELLQACVARIVRALPVEDGRDPIDPMRMQCLEATAAGKPHRFRLIDMKYLGTGWALAQTDDGGTLEMYARGYKAFIVYKQLDDGSYLYTVAKKSDLVAFPVKRILVALDAIEPGWGGGSCIGGSPRNADGSRSRLEPDRLAQLVEEVVCQ